MFCPRSHVVIIFTSYGVLVIWQMFFKCTSNPHNSKGLSFGRHIFIELHVICYREKCTNYRCIGSWIIWKWIHLYNHFPDKNIEHTSALEIHLAISLCHYSFFFLFNSQKLLSTYNVTIWGTRHSKTHTNNYSKCYKN